MVRIENKIIDNKSGLVDDENSGTVVDVFDYYTEKAVEDLDDSIFRLDIGTGFLFFSGFQEAHESFERLENSNILAPVEEDDWGTKAPIRVVMGQETDSYTKNVLSGLVKDGVTEYENDTVNLLKDLIDQDLIDFRVIKDQNFHPKIYSFYLESNTPDDIWSGSANFSRSGLSNNIELCTPMRVTHERRTNFREWFDNLWEAGSEDLDMLEIIDEVESSEHIYYVPKVFFAKLVNMLGRDYLLEKAPGTEKNLLLDFQDLTYNIVMNRLQNYGGYILANSVGTGKTYVASQTAATYLKRNPNERVLVVSPSNVMDEWEETAEEFEIEDRVDIESRGILQKPPRDDKDAEPDRRFDARKYSEEYSLIIVDEAHSYRNNSNRRDNLEEIIKSNKDADVLLTSATPINLSPNDLFQLIDLFRNGNRKSKFESSEMNEFYLNTRRRFKKLDNYNEFNSSLLKNIKKIESEFSIKITWRIIQEEFEQDLHELAGEEVEYEDPNVKEIEYTYPDEKIRENIFDEIVPFLEELYYEPAKLWSDQEYKEDTNLIFRQKWRMYKRLESSIPSFQNSIKKLYARNIMYKAALESSDAILDGDIENIIGSRGKLESVISESEIEGLINREAERRKNLVETYQELDDVLQKQVIERIESDIEQTQKMMDRISEHAGEVTEIPRKGDTKVDELVDIVEEHLEKNQPLLIFSEFVPTVEYLEKSLSEKLSEHADKIRAIHGRSGRSKSAFVDRYQDGDIDVAITTEMLSEGVNIPRADVVVNYDLPYNPTELIQRTGRALRITNPKKVEVRNFKPEDSVDKELDLYETLDTRLNRILQIAGLDFIVWMMDDQKVEELHEDEKEEYLDHLQEYKDEISTEDPEKVASGESAPQETKTDRILRKAIQEFDIDEKMVENLSAPSENSKPIYTTLRTSNGEEGMSIIGSIGEKINVWKALQDSVEPNPEAPERNNGLSESDKEKIETISEEKEEDYRREQTAAEATDRDIDDTIDTIREVGQEIEDEEMLRTLEKLRRGVENRLYNAEELNRIDESCKYILEENFSLMRNPDEIIQEDQKWSNLEELGSRQRDSVEDEAKPRAIIKYQDEEL